MRTLFASALLISALITAPTPVVGPQPGAHADGKVVLAQRFCPNGRC
jgi:hypothetical protein